MTKVYYCIDKNDGKESTAVVNERGCAWIGGHQPMEKVERNERYYAYDPLESFKARAINAFLVAEF